MKASKFTEAQKAFILKQGEEGTPVAEICRKAGISQATYFNWKKRYGGFCCGFQACWRDTKRPGCILYLTERCEIFDAVLHCPHHPPPFSCAAARGSCRQPNASSTWRQDPHSGAPQRLMPQSVQHIPVVGWPQPSHFCGVFSYPLIPASPDGRGGWRNI